MSNPGSELCTPHPPTSEAEPSSAAAEGSRPIAARTERRGSGRRARARDRLMDRATRPYTPNAALTGIDNVENLLLFVDDDLRETALAITRIETYLSRTLAVLERKDLQREHVRALAEDVHVLEHLDLLNETLESLRRRLARLCAAMR